MLNVYILKYFYINNNIFSIFVVDNNLLRIKNARFNCFTARIVATG